MVNGAGGGDGPGSRTTAVTIEEPVLVPMSEAERAATVSVLMGILADWWAKHDSEDRSNDAESRSAIP